MCDVSVCGSLRESCYCYGKMCDGCNKCCGKVFHVSEGNACPIYDCAVNQKGLKNCGECAKAPCEIWRNTRDPKYSDEEFEANINERLKQLHNII